MKEQELKALTLSKDLWNAIVALPVQHISDNADVNFHIHAIQNIILARPGYREYLNTNKP